MTIAKVLSRIANQSRLNPRIVKISSRLFWSFRQVCYQCMDIPLSLVSLALFVADFSSVFR